MDAPLLSTAVGTRFVYVTGFDAVAVMVMSPVTRAMDTTPVAALYAVAVMSVPPMLTVTVSKVYPFFGVSVVVYAAPSSTAVAALLPEHPVSIALTVRMTTAKSNDSVRS